MPIKNSFIAYAYLTLSMFFLGATVVMGKMLISYFPIFLLLGSRFLIGSVWYSMLYFFEDFSYKDLISQLDKSDWKLLFFQSFFGAFLFNLLTLYGLKFISPNVAAILTSTIPAFIALFAFLILKEKISTYKIISLLLAILGLILVTADTSNLSINHLSTLGNIFIIAGVISGALFPIFVKLLSNKIPIFYISFSFNVYGFLLFLPFALKESINFNFTSIHLNGWLLVVLYSFTANVLYLNFWNKGLAIIDASTASLFVPVMPISTMILAYIFLGDKITLFQFFGILIVIMAITSSTLKKSDIHKIS